MQNDGIYVIISEFQFIHEFKVETHDSRNSGKGKGASVTEIANESWSSRAQRRVSAKKFCRVKGVSNHQVIHFSCIRRFKLTTKPVKFVRILGWNVKKVTDNDFFPASGCTRK